MCKPNNAKNRCIKIPLNGCFLKSELLKRLSTDPTENDCETEKTSDDTIYKCV